MQFLKWYLIVGVIVNTIVAIYNVKKYADWTAEWTSKDSFVAKSKLIIECIGAFILGWVLWLPASIIDILIAIVERLNK